MFKCVCAILLMGSPVGLRESGRFEPLGPNAEDPTIRV